MTIADRIFSLAPIARPAGRRLIVARALAHGDLRLGARNPGLHLRVFQSHKQLAGGHLVAGLHGNFRDKAREWRRDPDLSRYRLDPAGSHGLPILLVT